MTLPVFRFSVATLLPLVVLGMISMAQAETPFTPQQLQAIKAAVVSGPASVDIAGEATLALPQGYQFLPKKEALDVLRHGGSYPSGALVGIVVPARPNGSPALTIVIDYNDAGYVKDDEADKIDAEKLLQGYRDTAVTQNEKRQKQGIAPLDIAGWAETPHYEAATHRLIWSVAARLRAAQGEAANPPSVNYNTRLLGRHGYVSVDLVTSQAAFEANRAYGGQILQAITFLPGKAYADYNAGTDKTAEFGLLALIGGVAAHKLGLLAMGGLFFAKFAKLTALAVAGIGVTVQRILKRPGRNLKP